MRKLLTLAVLGLAILGFTSLVAAQSAGEVVASGEELSKKWDYKGAIAVYEKALVGQANNYDLLWRVADNYVKLGVSADDKEKAPLYQKASDYATKAVAANPEAIDGHTKLAIAQGRLALFKGGKIKVEMSKTVKAEAERALQINPNNDEALHTLGAWHREVATLPGILKVFAKLIYGGLPPASKEEAVQYLEKATASNPKIIEHHLELGKCYMVMRQWDLARKSWAECGNLTPTEGYDKKFQEEAKGLLSEYKNKK